MTVSQMLESMDVEEYLSWQAFERVEPFGPIRLDIAIAKPIAALMSLKTRRPVKPSDIMPDYESRYKPKIVDAAALQQMLIARIGGKVNGPR